jgi:hypothetical protein
METIFSSNCKNKTEKQAKFSEKKSKNSAAHENRKNLPGSFLD